MKDIICPLDGKPCEKDCPDRYIDHPGGGCFLTTAQGMGAKLIDLGGGDVGMMFTPNGKKVKHDGQPGFSDCEATGANCGCIGEYRGSACGWGWF